jgi:flagellar biogenesis protein FliO
MNHDNEPMDYPNSVYPTVVYPAYPTAVYEAVFGNVAPAAALEAVPEPARNPQWRRAQFFLERVFLVTLGVTLRMTQRLTARMTRRAPRRLLLCESLPLGERRFVAVVEFERARFLLGGTSASLVLLARLDEGSQKKGSEKENDEEEGHRKNTNAVPPGASPTAETSGGVQP